jgi:prepilin-type N-terminal cleavage/methylation domain-containing protein
MKTKPDTETWRHGDRENAPRSSESPRLRVSPSLRLLPKGYTLIEVLAASTVVAIGMSAMVSLTGTLMLQEEMTWRVAVTRNYQENMGRLWQLGVRPEDVLNLMPSQADNAQLNLIINGTPSILQFVGTTSPSGLGAMQSATVTAAVNISQNPRTESQGSPLTLSFYRPSLPSSLRPAAP